MEPEEILEAVVVTSKVLPEDLYARNSIVFLVDVSQSMANKGKMDLLKASMLGLVEVLRSTDQVAFYDLMHQKAVVVIDYDQRGIGRLNLKRRFQHWRPVG